MRQSSKLLHDAFAHLKSSNVGNLLEKDHFLTTAFQIISISFWVNCGLLCIGTEQ